MLSVKSTQIVLAFFWEKFTNLLTCLWDIQIFPAEAVTSEEGNHQSQEIGRPYSNCSLDFLGGTHENARSGLQMTVLGLKDVRRLKYPLYLITCIIVSIDV